MAKYRLSNNNRLVECSILDENLLANTYTVKFNNGIIKDVSKNRVSNLDHIDEGVLDRLKEFASSLWDNIVKAGKYVVLKIKGMLVPVTTPINTMVAAQSIDGVSFYPSEDLADAAEELGIPANVIEDEKEEDEDYIEDVNNYWEQVVKDYISENSIEESFRPRKKIRRLYEADGATNVGGDNFEIESLTWPNYSANEIVDLLLDQYNAFLNGNAQNGVGSIPIPYCIWGSPGVGKTQIIEEVVDIIREEEGRATIISINAMSMRKDDFAFPVKSEIEREVVNARGERVKYNDVRGGDVLKTWLPVYKPGDKDAEMNGITDEQLDDIANGGDGSGNGRGGVIFFDELSRISADVLNIIMTLVQNRKFNEYVLGSKWMIVAAANPPQVLGAAGERMQWDPAQTDRFSHCFLKPSFQEWLVWAKSPIKGTNRPHIHADIIKFLVENPDCWNNASMVNKEDKKDKVAKSKFPNPRGWESVSKERYNREDARAAEQDPTSFRARAAARRGMRPRPLKLTPSEMGDVVTSNVGKIAAERYQRYYSFDGVFSSEIAQSVWEDGENTEIPFNSSGLSMVLNRAIDKIFDNHPDKLNGESNATITPEQYTNLCKYVIRCVDMMDEDAGASKDVVLKAAKTEVETSMAKSPFRINLNKPENIAKYKEGMLMMDKRLRQTMKNIKDLRESKTIGKLYNPSRSFRTSRLSI